MVGPATPYASTTWKKETVGSPAQAQPAAAAGTSTECTDPNCVDCAGGAGLADWPAAEWDDDLSPAWTEAVPAEAGRVASTSVGWPRAASSVGWPRAASPALVGIVAAVCLDDDLGWPNRMTGLDDPSGPAAPPATRREERKGDTGGEKVKADKAVSRPAVARTELTTLSSGEQLRRCIREIRDLTRNHDTATVRAVNECVLRFKSLINSDAFYFSSSSDALSSAMLLQEDPFKTNDLAIKLSTNLFWNILNASTKKLGLMRKSYSSLLKSNPTSCLDAEIQRYFQNIIKSINRTRYDKPDDLKRFVDLKKELQDPFFATFKDAQEILRHLNKMSAKSTTYHENLGEIITQFESV